MDPQDCLFAAESCIAEGNQELAADALNCYAEWRQTGGFEPVMPADRINYSLTLGGDEYHRALVAVFQARFNVAPL